MEDEICIRNKGVYVYVMLQESLYNHRFLNFCSKLKLKIIKDFKKKIKEAKQKILKWG